MAELDPSKIMQVGLGFWGSKCLLSAVELGLFTQLARQPMTGKQLEKKLELHPRATYDFLDALLAMGFLGPEDALAGARVAASQSTAVLIGEWLR